jgi:hypothetical protein
MGDRSANSYDLLQAQQILHALTRKQGAVPDDKPELSPAANYSRLPKMNPTIRDNPVVAPVSANLPDCDEKPDESQQTFDSWESCIAWCMSLSKAEAAFVVDSQGFVIASRGRIPGQGFEGTGAEMVCLLEQLERVAPDAGKLAYIDMEFDKRRIFGAVAADEGTEFYVVGLVAPEPMNNASKQRLLQQIIRNLPNMD